MADSSDLQPRQLQKAAEFHHMALRLREKGALLEARPLCARAVALFEKHAGAHDPDTAHAQVELGEILHHLGDFAEADRCFKAASGSLRRYAGKKEPEDFQRLFLRALLSWSLTQMTAGQHAAANRTLVRAGRYVRATFRSRDLAHAAVSVSTGVLRKAQGRYNDARALYLKAMPVLLAAGESADLATLYHNLGGIEHARGHFRTAEAHARRGLSMRKKLFGTRHPDVAADASALAAILDARGKRAEAETLYLETLTFFRSRFGVRSYEVAINLDNLGALYRNGGQLKKAEVCFRKALGIEETLLGRKHADTGLTLNNLAVVLAARGATAEAKRTYKRALAAFAASVGTKHPHHRACAKNLARLSLVS